MLERYSALYRDQFGQETTYIRNNGSELRMMLRGVEFRADEDVEWEACESDSTLLSQFLFTHPTPSALCGYTLEWAMPITIIKQQEEQPAMLSIQSTLSAPNSMGACTSMLHVSLQYEGPTISASDSNFEWALEKLHEQLPEGMTLKICLFCALSCYPAFYSASFTHLGCFRKSKDQCRSRLPFIGLSHMDALTLFSTNDHEFMQVTYCCPEFISKVHFSKKSL